MKNIKAKIHDFVFSYGLMLAGVFLLFVSSVFFTSLPAQGDSSFVSNFPLYTGEGSGGVIVPAKPLPPFLKTSEEYTATLTAFAALVMDDASKTVLFEKNSGERRPLASITKLMSAMVFLDLSLDWSKVETVMETDTQDDHHLRVGEEYTLEDLWYVGLVGSSNTAINALVRSSGLPTENFVALMNKKAKDLRLFSAAFVDPTGLSEQNMASAFDAARLLREALRYEKIYKALQRGECYAEPRGGEKRRVWSTNWLLTNWIPNNFPSEDIAGKTGYIPGARYNFAVSLTGDKRHPVIAVVLGADSNESRFSEARDLAEWTFANYLWPEDEGYDKPR